MVPLRMLFPMFLARCPWKLVVAKAPAQEPLPWLDNAVLIHKQRKYFSKLTFPPFQHKPSD